MPSLLDLPDELISPILALTCAAPAHANPTEVLIASYGTYHAVALSCKRLLFLTRPLLYERITFADSKDPWNKGGRFIGFSRDMQRLARTLCEKPHLRPLIRSLSVHRCPSSPCTYQGTALGQEVEFRALLKRVAVGGMRGDKVAKVGDWNCQGVWTAILILLAPRVRHLSVDEDELGNTEVFCSHADATCLDKVLGMIRETLEVARLQGASDSFGMMDIQTCALQHVSPAVLADFMVRPGMQKVVASLIHPREETWSEAFQDLPVGTSEVTSLQLSDAGIRQDWMRKIIGSCRALESLCYEVVSAEFRFPPVIEPSMLGEALEEHRTSLKTLRIIDSTHRGDAFAHSESSFDSLATFSNLVHLEIDLQAIAGAHSRHGRDLMEFMPHGLKTLKVHTADFAQTLPYLLAELGSIQDRTVEELTISCRVEPRSIRDAQNEEYFGVLSIAEPNIYRGQDIFIKRCRGNYWRHPDCLWERMEIQCRNLQGPDCARLEVVAAGLGEEDGIKRMIASQAISKVD